MAEDWKLVIAAGGTGGHIMPALAVGSHLARVAPECRIEYVCGMRPVEAEIYRKAGIAPRAIETYPFQWRWTQLLANLVRFRRSLKIAREFLAADPPRVALGMGGYASVPVVAEAAAMPIPTLIHEQNSVAGRANRWLSKRVTAIACAYSEAAAAFPAAKTVVTGNPVRPECLGGNRTEGLARWGLSADVATLLVSGGSQGAQRLNRFVIEALERLDAVAGNIGGLQIIWSCGEANFRELNDRLKGRPLERVAVRLEPFIREMGLAYAVADLAFCRAGAITLAELTANAVPAILAPLPEAVGDHQRLNALPLVRAGCAILIEENELDGMRLAEEWARLLADRARLEQMRSCARQMGRPKAVEEIVEMILRLKGYSRGSTQAV